MALVQAGKYGFGGSLGRNLIWPVTPHYVLDADAESKALAAATKLSALPAGSIVVLTSELRDSCDAAPFANEEVFRRLAVEEGLELAVSVSVDRRGYLHRLVLRKTETAVSRIGWRTDK